MRMMSALAAATLIIAMPLATQAQTKPADDHAGTSRPGPGMQGGGMGMMGGGDMSHMMAMMHGGGMMMGGMPHRHIEGRLAFLKTELKITPAQEPQWTKFADAVRATMKSASEGMRPMMPMMGGGGMMQGGRQQQTALEIFNRDEKALTIRLEAVRAVKGAFEPLYAVLSDEQKKTANELLTSPMGIM